MVVGLLTVERHVPGAHSLKEKRMVVRRVKDRLKKFNVAVSEIDHQDLWQRARLTAALTSGSLATLSAAADGLERWLEARCPTGGGVQRIIASVEDLRP